MKPIYKIPFVFLIPIVILLYANSTGSVGGKTGSPGDSGVTCVECHTGGPANAVSGWISTNIPEAGYTPGQTYEITATGTHSGVVRFGFELTAENTSGGKVGTLIITEPGRTQLTNNNQAVTHTFNGINPTGNTNAWSMNWTAPPTDIGQVRFYAAFNAANGDGNTTGDVIYVSSLFVNAAQPPALLSVNPNSATQGDGVLLTISGQNTSWAGTTPNVRLRNVANPGLLINASNVTATSNTIIMANFDFSFEAPFGLYDLLVNDLVLAASFTIHKIPLLLTVVPNTGAQGEFIEVGITADETTWSGTTPHVELVTDFSLPIQLLPESVQVISDTELLVAFDIPIDQVTGPYILVVSQCAPLENAFTVTVIDGLSERNNKQINMYPNPAIDVVWVESEEGGVFRIFDLNGRLVMEQNILAGRKAISLNGISKGVFITEIVSESTRNTERLIVR